VPPTVGLVGDSLQPHSHAGETIEARLSASEKLVCFIQKRPNNPASRRISEIGVAQPISIVHRGQVNAASNLLPLGIGLLAAVEHRVCVIRAIRTAWRKHPIASADRPCPPRAAPRRWFCGPPTLLLVSLRQAVNRRSASRRRRSKGLMPPTPPATPSPPSDRACQTLR
jgi:hypothetical protein